MASISTLISVSFKNPSKAGAKTKNPGGTGILAWLISPSEAPFPPAIEISFLDKLLNNFINPTIDKY